MEFDGGEISPWGRLLPCAPNLERIDLFGPIITFGRSDNCDVILSSITAASKEHFCIIKEQKFPVYLLDVSKNGTFINTNPVNKGQKHMLHNDDVIAIGHRSVQAYIFKLIIDYYNGENDLPEELRSEYISGALITRGSYKETKYCFEKKTSKTHIIKKLIKSRKLNGVQAEINVLRSLSHPCLIELKEITECVNEVYIVTEFIKSDNLASQIDNGHGFCESDIKLIFYQMLLALHYLHKMSIIHKNLKPQNVFILQNGTFLVTKITDFGLTQLTDELDSARYVSGINSFLAPELLDAHSNSYDEKVDVWSLGEILYYMIFKRLPFQGLDRHVSSNSVYSSDDWRNNSSYAQDLIQNMLAINPETRIPINDVFKHRWLEEDNELKYKVNKWIDNNPKDTLWGFKPSKKPRLEFVEDL